MAEPTIDWGCFCPNPVSVVILPWEHGLTIPQRDASGKLYGCRDVSDGPCQVEILDAWIADGIRCGLAVEDLRPSSAARALGSVALRNAIGARPL